MHLIKHIRNALLSFILLFGNNLISQTPPDTLKVGFYLISIRNIDFTNNSFNADAWVWLHFNNPKKHKFSINKDFPETLEWGNDITEQTLEGKPVTEDSSSTILYRTYKIKRKFLKKWDISCYPFDKQTFEIKLESDFWTQDDLIITTDNAQIDSEFLSTQKDWKPIKNSEVFESYIVRYNSSFGAFKGKEDHSEYSGVRFKFDTIRLNRWTTFFKLFTGILISFLIALSVFLIKPTNLDARFGLVVGALFSSIGSKYIIDSLLPVYYENTMFDNIHNVTFIYIFIIILLSIFSLKLLESNDIKSNSRSKKLDMIGLTSCFISYFAIIIFIVKHSINN